MPQHIDDDVLNTFVTIGTYDTISQKLLDRFGGLITDCEFSIAVKNEADTEVLRKLARDIQSASLKKARDAIVGAPS
jgi:hypothetical protein